MKKFLSALCLIAMLAAICCVPALADTTMYTTGNVYMRTGAGTEYARIRVLSKGTEVTRLGSKTSSAGTVWYKVKYNGKTGYVMSAYLESADSEGEITMVGGNSYLRKKPSINASVLGTMRKGDSAEYFDTAYDDRDVLWYKVELDGVTGWVSSKYTSEGDWDEEDWDEEDWDEETEYVKATKGNTYIRRTYDISSKSLAVLKKGELAEYLGVSRYDDRSPAVKWYKVELDGITGWVSSKYTKIVSD